MEMRTPLKNARNLGSAKEGAEHFWQQRLTGIANAVLGIFLVWLVVSLAGASHSEFKDALGNPFIALGLAALVLSGTWHMRLGMQTIIEDYAHSEVVKIVLLIGNTFFCMSVALACLYAILKLSFGH